MSRQRPEPNKPKKVQAQPTARQQTRHRSVLLVACHQRPDALHASRARAPWCTNTSGRHCELQGQRLGARRQHETEVDSEAGMLSGISRKRSIRSNPCWFTEFCKSQCLSHFAAPFIVVRAETSVAESCKGSNHRGRLPPTGRMSTTHERGLKIADSRKH